MKKKIFWTAIIIATVVVTSWNLNQNKNDKNITNLILVCVESLASCEVSGDNSQNTGFCVRRFDTQEYACVTTANPSLASCMPQ